MTLQFRIGPTLVVLAATVLAFGIAVLAFRTFATGSDRSSWKLTAPAEGVELHIAVQVGGCDEFDRTRVRESETEVAIEAYINHNARSSCDDILNYERMSVRLKSPLGDRRLTGCNPSDAVYDWPDVANDDCTTAILP